MFNKFKEDIFQEVKIQVKIKDVANKLGLKLETVSNYLAGQCPTNHSSVSGKSFHVMHHEEYFRCYNCGVAGDAVRLVEITKGISPLEAARWIINHFNLNISIDQSKFNPQKIEEQREASRKSAIRTQLYNELIKWGKELLFDENTTDEEAKETLRYLTEDRKYELDVLKNTEFFYIPSTKAAKDYLMSTFPHNKQDVLDLKVTGGGFNDQMKINIPFRLSDGTITGLVKRYAGSLGLENGKNSDGTPKYSRWDSTPKLKKDSIFGLSKLAHGTETIIAVEGYPDAEYLNAAGIENITAIGQGIFSKEYLKGLRDKKIKNVIVSLDNDKVDDKKKQTPKEKTRYAVKLLLSNSKITPFVIDPEELGNAKDCDEYYRMYGIEALKKLIDEKSIPGVLWVVKELISGIKENNTLSKQKAREDILDFASLVRDRILLDDIQKTAKETFGITALTFKREIKLRKKDYSDNLKYHLENDPIIPFVDESSVLRCYYNAIHDVLHVGVDKEIVKDIMHAYELTAPENYPVFNTKFDPLDLGDKFREFEKVFNLFTPTEFMRMTKNSDKIDLITSCPRIFVLLRNLIPIDAEREHFINWLSCIFSTRKKLRTTWVLYGPQGAGKNMFFDSVIKPLFGEKQTITIEDARLQSDFNSYLKGQLFIAFNEVANDDTSTKKSVKNKIKGIITDKKVVINEKHIREFELDNHANTFFFSNESLPVLIEKQDRRFNVVNTGPILTKVPTFKSNPDKFIADIEKELYQFAQYLLNYNYCTIKADEVLDNEPKRQMQEYSMNRFELFASKLIDNDWGWFDEHYPDDKVDFFQKRNQRDGLMTEAELNSRECSREKIRKTYSWINDGYTSMTKLTRQLKLYGVSVVDKGSVKSDRYYYKW